MIVELVRRIYFWRKADRIGPDIPWTHWRLHFKSTMWALCKEHFLAFGDGSEFRPGAYAVACSRIRIGRRVVIRPGSILMADPRQDGAGITIEDDVLIGSAVHIYTQNHRFDDPSLPIIDQGHSPSRPVTLKRGCWVGAAAIVLPGVTIGENAVVGAGSIVTSDIPANAVAVGSPARIVRRNAQAK